TRIEWTKSLCSTTAVRVDWLAFADCRTVLIRPSTMTDTMIARTRIAVHHWARGLRAGGSGDTGCGARAGPVPRPAAGAGATSAAVKSIDGLSNRTYLCAYGLRDAAHTPLSVSYYTCPLAWLTYFTIGRSSAWSTNLPELIIDL